MSIQKITSDEVLCAQKSLNDFVGDIEYLFYKVAHSKSHQYRFKDHQRIKIIGNCPRLIATSMKLALVNFIEHELDECFDFTSPEGSPFRYFITKFNNTLCWREEPNMQLVTKPNSTKQSYVCSCRLSIHKGDSK